MTDAASAHWEYAIRAAKIWNAVWVIKMTREATDYRKPSSATLVAAKASPSAATPSSM